MTVFPLLPSTSSLPSPVSLPSPAGLDGLTDDDLAEQIVTWSGRLAAGEARLLDLVAEFDRREAWGGPGLLSCAHWLQWRVGLSPGAAREKVRVARRLQELPLVRKVLQEGRLSYSKARAVTRVATVEDQQVWVDLAAHATAGQLERLSRGVRRVQRIEQDAADPELAAYRVRASKRYGEDGTVVYTVRLPAEQAALLDAALEQTRAELDRAVEPDRSAEHTRPEGGQGVSAETPRRSTLADGLLAMAAAVLDRAGGAVARRSRAALTVQVDPLSGWGRLRDGELLPPASLQRVLRALPGRANAGLRPLLEHDLWAFDSGRARRRPSAELRDLIGTLDGERCRYPGCTRHRRLHAHHVVHWSEGGRTDLGNLVLLCPRHHTLVHATGTSLVLHPDRRLDVMLADGTPVAHLPEQPWAEATALPDISAETLPAPLADRLDLGYAVSVLVQQAA